VIPLVVAVIVVDVVVVAVVVGGALRKGCTCLSTKVSNAGEENISLSSCAVMSCNPSSYPECWS